MQQLPHVEDVDPVTEDLVQGAAQVCIWAVYQLVLQLGFISLIVGSGVSFPSPLEALEIFLTASSANARSWDLGQLYFGRTYCRSCTLLAICTCQVSLSSFSAY